MRHVQLDEIESRCHGPPRRGSERVGQGANLRSRQFLGKRPIRVERQLRRRDRRPRIFVRAERLPALPRAVCRAFAAGVRELNTEQGALGPTERIAARMRATAVRCASDQSPRQPWVIRPRGSTAVASSITTPAPDMASVMAFCRCHSVGSPSIAEYWHIGEIAIRFGATSGPISMG
jgi:hypothetical protein